MNNLTNHIHLQGFTVMDAELIADECGEAAIFSLATSSIKRGSGGKVIELQWQQVIARDRLAKEAMEKVKQGSDILVEGRLGKRAIEDSIGRKMKIPVILAEQITVVRLPVARKVRSHEGDDPGREYLTSA